ncbi:hypothetical protein [Amycolatopsis vastitatis]|uniref:Uncharacterized protein n=1 Tax=Amycolatopsis vastitatis TaxID=1905142 RepID=A0A229SLG9_9PSEU|nr:hypothetical protein [Amycolatopsis vastitatis]OXM59594.1 hypothetical protein CF165_46750 [Amycolatopsis vastitatis]
MDHNQTGGRHRRRRDNSITRAALDEARRAGLVQRHLTKLRRLATRPATAQPGTAPGIACPSTTEPAGLPPDRFQPAGTDPADRSRPSTSEAA